MSEWLTDWYRAHRDRHPSAKLPGLESTAGETLFASWAKEIRTARIDLAAATAASERMLLQPPKSEKWHLATFMNYALEAMEAREPRSHQPRHDLSTIEGCKAASASCQRCDGNGLTTVWHRAPDPDQRISPTSAAYCVCAYGRWIRGIHAAKEPDVRCRIPDLEDVLAGRGPWLEEPPELPIHQQERIKTHAHF